MRVLFYHTIPVETYFQAWKREIILVIFYMDLLILKNSVSKELALKYLLTLIRIDLN